MPESLFMPQRPTTPRSRQTVANVLADRVADRGDHPWLIEGERRVSYREMDVLSNRLANGLSDAGVRSGDTVLYMLRDSIELVALWCALAKLGAIEVPINVHLRGNTLGHLVSDSQAKLLVSEAGFLDRFADIETRMGKVERLIVHGDGVTPATLRRLEPAAFDTLPSADTAPPAADPKGHDLVAVMYTSGTTGPSKGVMVTHIHAWEYACGCMGMVELGPGDVYYAPLPLFHIAGQWAVVYACAIAGATAVIPPAFSASGFWDDVRRFGATTSFLLGAMANLLSRQPERDDDADNPMQRMLVVPLLPDIEAFKCRFGVQVSTTWGSTEVNVPTRSGFDLANSRTCGRVETSLYEVRIVDADDNEVSVGTPGEAVVRARDPWMLMAGYWNNPVGTLAAWRNLWLHSGDVLLRDEAGNLYFVDRVKDAIRRRGENISSMEVEYEINAHPAVLECAVIPVDSEHGEQDVMAVVVPKPGQVVDPVDLIRFLEPRMAYFSIPRYLEFTDSLPRTQTGKIQKFTLRERGTGASTWDREAAGVRLGRG
jgi:carnitine-CoA ligase